MFSEDEGSTSELELIPMSVLKERLQKVKRSFGFVNNGDDRDTPAKKSKREEEDEGMEVEEVMILHASDPQRAFRVQAGEVAKKHQVPERDYALPEFKTVAAEKCFLLAEEVMAQRREVEKDARALDEEVKKTEETIKSMEKHLQRLKSQRENMWDFVFALAREAVELDEEFMKNNK